MAFSQEGHTGKEKETLKEPQVPALIRRSGCKAWMEAKVRREDGTVPTQSIPVDGSLPGQTT